MYRPIIWGVYYKIGIRLFFTKEIPRFRGWRNNLFCVSSHMRNSKGHLCSSLRNISLVSRSHFSIEARNLKIFGKFSSFKCWPRSLKIFQCHVIQLKVHLKPGSCWHLLNHVLSFCLYTLKEILLCLCPYCLPSPSVIENCQ